MPADQAQQFLDRIRLRLGGWRGFALALRPRPSLGYSALAAINGASSIAARDAERLAMLTDEQAKTEKAIVAFASLAERLDALATRRARPWWHRLVGA